MVPASIEYVSLREIEVPTHPEAHLVRSARPLPVAGSFVLLDGEPFAVSVAEEIPGSRQVIIKGMRLSVPMRTAMRRIAGFALDAQAEEARLILECEHYVTVPAPRGLLLLGGLRACPTCAGWGG